MLTVGPTGSGETTTLYAALEFLNDEEHSLATIVDPVENQIPGITHGVMPIGGKIRHLIEASTEEIFAAAVAGGMITLREDGICLCRAGIISLEEIHRVTDDRLM